MLEHLLHQRGELRWLDTDAGALMLLPAKLKPLWSGIEPPKDGRVIEAHFRWNPDGTATDYDRACDIDDYAGLVSVGPGAGIVLGQDNLPATWQAFPDGGGVLARLYTSESGDYPDRLPKLPPNLAWSAVGEFTTDGSPLVLFDSTESGDEAPIFPSVPIHLAAGRYAVEHAIFKHPQMELWLVRLRPT